ncbi:MAG: glutamate racemase [Candidatus Eremiobacteraeota bacterium]|nr:glutamate racemase [Candidatus Eremiobacteraeota bacterium]
MIGLFDSGLGGLTVVRRVRERLPQADCVFFSDQAHVPYGDRRQEDLHRLLRRNLAWLEERKPDAIVMACNTSCAIADLYGWPQTQARVFDIIDSAAIALKTVDARRIGVVATTATVRSGAYARRIGAAIPSSLVIEVAAPALVPLVEAGRIEGTDARDAVEEVCSRLPQRLDAVVLACTHYPILDAHFAAILGDAVIRIDPAFVQADRVAAFSQEYGCAIESGITEYVTNGDVERFHASVSRIVGQPSHT